MSDREVKYSLNGEELMGTPLEDLMAMAGADFRDSRVPTVQDVAPDEDLTGEMAPERVVELAGSQDASVRAAIAQRHDCPLGVLTTLVHDSRAEVRAAVAAHPRLGGALTAVLEADKDSLVLHALLDNPVLDIGAIGRLSGHRNDAVRDKASRMLYAMQERANGTGFGADASLPPELRDRVV